MFTGKRLVAPWKSATGMLGGSVFGALVMAMIGCASVEPRFLTPEGLASHIRSVGASRIVVPFALDDEMTDWVAEAVSPGGSDATRLGILADRLLAENGLGVTYSRDTTGTAREVFDSREANCLAFTNLFVGMARTLGIEVEFLEVRDLDTYSRDGDLIVHSDHVAVGFGPRHQRTIIDFASEPGPQYRRIRVLTDLEAAALYYSNRGTELLRTDEMEGALRWLTDAVRVAPNLAIAWVNLGVVLRRMGDFGASETAYRQALELDADEFSAYQNLSVLLTLSGRESEALDLLALTDTNKNRNPYSHLALGDLSFKNGRWAEAERFYRRALRVQKEDVNVVAGLGLAVLYQGNPKAANRWLRKARKLDSQASSVLRLSSEIKRKQASGSGAGRGG